jgi:hypothetical protein
MCIYIKYLELFYIRSAKCVHRKLQNSIQKNLRALSGAIISMHLKILLFLIWQLLTYRYKAESINVLRFFPKRAKLFLKYI